MANRRLLPTLLGLALVVLLALIRLADPAPVQAVRDLGFDFYQRLLPRPDADSPVRVVDIDEAALARLGQWPWPRSELALLTDRLNELGAAAIGFDLLFPEPDRLSTDNDTLFAAALSRANAALGFSIAPQAAPLALEPKAGIAISGADPTAALPRITGAAAPLPQLAAAASGLGGLSLDSADQPGMVRRLPLLFADGTRVYPALSLETLRLALGVSTLVVLGDTGGLGTVSGVRLGGRTIPTTANGDLVLYEQAGGPPPAISAARLFDSDYAALREEIEGRIVLVGTSASGLLDVHATPLLASVAGVQIHAAAIGQIVAGRYLTRADWLSGLEILVVLVAGVMLVVVVLRLGPLAGLATLALAIAVIVATSWGAFALQGWQLDATFPVGAALLAYGAMVYFQFSLTERERRALRRAFGHYVAPELLARIEANAGALRLGGEARDITVMFADMRGFTRYTEAHTPEQTLTLLNELFGALGDEIVGRSGTIDKFIGDAIMAFWNAPLDVAEHSRLAALAALAMRVRLDALNAGSGEPIAIGIGLCTGTALVGNMGLESRFDYSAIGDSVNVASRVEGESKAIGFDIVAADSTRRAAPDLAWLEAGSVQLKGKAKRLPIHILVGDATLAQSAAFDALRRAHRALIAGQGDVQECMRLAVPVMPGLSRFYALVPGRAADFASPE